MKRKTRSLLALALSTQMIFSLSACGSKKQDSSGPGQNAGISSGAESDSGSDSGSGSTSKSSGNSRIVSENDLYYNVASSPLQASVAQDKKIHLSDIGNRYIVGDRILADVYVSYEMPDDVTEKMMKLNLDDEKQLEEYTRIDAEYNQSSLQLFDLNGAYISEIKLEQDCMFQGAYPGKDGEILLLSNKFNMNICKSVPIVSVISPSGEKIRDIDLQVKDELEDVRIYVLEDGNILLASIGKVWILDSEGKIVHEIANKDLNGSVLHSGGKWYAVMPKYTANGTEIYVQEIDTANGKLAGNPVKSNSNVYRASQGDKDCFLLNANGIEKFDVETGATTQVLAWKDTDINSETLRLDGARISSEDDMVFFQYDAAYEAGRGSMDMKSKGANMISIVHLTKADKNPHAGKTRLKLGIDGNISCVFLEHVLEYNKDPNNTARIEITDYTADVDIYGNNSDVEQGLLDSTNQLVMDMLSGNGPDILVGYSELSRFNTDTMLVDLNPMIDSDSTVNRDELFDNILRSFESDGKLYTLPLTYTLEGMAVNTSFSGAKENWTFADFEQMASSLSSDVQPLASESQDELLKLWMRSLSSHFIDDQNQTVDFESEEFRALLETVKKYGMTKDPDADRTGLYMNFDNKHFNENMIASLYTSLCDLQSYATLSKESSGHTVAFTGVPSLNGMGMAAQGQLSMAVTTSCEDTDLAWEFIRSFLKEDIQEDLSFNSDTLPVNKNAFRKNCQIEIEVNNKALQNLKDSPAAAMDPDIVDVYVELTDAHVDAMANLISSVSSSQSWDNDIMDIVLEETAGFFAGQRTVDDVCKIIQNRANIVVKER